MSIDKVLKEFDGKFIWNVRPVGVKKGDKDHKEYVLGMWIKDWSDDTTLKDIKDFIRQVDSQAEARGREERDKYWLKRMNNFERINKLPKDKIAGWSWLKTQISDLLTKLGDQNE